jgi:hypothetical protein
MKDKKDKDGKDGKDKDGKDGKDSQDDGSVLLYVFESRLYNITQVDLYKAVDTYVDGYPIFEKVLPEEG